MTENEIRALIAAAVRKYGTVRRAGVAMGVADNHLSGIKNGNRPISKKVLEYFGITRRTVYEMRQP